MINKNNKLGQVFTPEYIVDLILDELEYKEHVLFEKTIIEPSFGEGVFLINIVDRIISYGLSTGKSKKFIKNILETKVYGIEIDRNLYSKTIKNLNKLTKKHNIFNINWNLFNENTIFYNYKNKLKFDYVVGNPPYIKLHDIDEKTLSELNKFKFHSGMTDMYIIFFEIGLNLLNNTGKLGYITPNSYIKNTSQKEFRNYLIKNNLIQTIIDFKSYKVFKNADTYTAVTILNKFNISPTLKYACFEGCNELYRHNIPLPLKTLDLALNKLEDEQFLIDMGNRPFSLNELCFIQYGLTTNRDKVYIDTINTINNSLNVVFNNYEIEPFLLKKVKKGSKITENKDKYILFPYIWNKIQNKYVLIPEKCLKRKYPLTYKYLLANKDILLSRNINKSTKWYEYGRSQGFNYINNERITIGHIFKGNELSFNSYELKPMELLYSGIYFYPKNGISIDELLTILKSEDFIKYCSIVGKDMSGGFKVISPKFIKKYRPQFLIPI